MYDVAILGAGPGGYVAGIRAGQLGLKVCVIESGEIAGLGGVCLQWGCIPSKALLKNASVLHTIQHAEDFGISVSDVRPDYGKGVDRSRKVVDQMVGGIGMLFKKYKVEHIQGRGVIAGKGRVKVGDREIQAKNLIIATGGNSRLFFDLKPDGKTVFTAKEFVHMRDLPSSMIVLGAGAIGVEFAYVLANYGVKVTVIEMADHILPKEDKEVASVVERSLKKLGIEFLTKTKVESVEQRAEGISVKVSLSDGSSKTLEAPRLLSATGVVPNSKGIGLEAVGVKTSPQGFIEIDEWMRTNVEGIYAIGDVTGKAMLAHVASAQGVVCIEKIAGKNPQALDYLKVPVATYCEPQVASMGLTEEDARSKGHQVKVGKFHFVANGKAVGLGEPTGFIKVVADAKYGEILGIHMVGPEVTELLGEASLAMTLEATTHEVDVAVHPHPTLSEAFKEAALAALGSPIHS